MKFIITTTINEKSKAIEAFEEFKDWQIVIVGDKKTPFIKSGKNLTFLSVEDQEKLGYHIVKECSFDHYARKNIGFIYAISHGASIIYEVDDDNFPEKTWELPVFSCSHIIETHNKFVNIYRHFCDKYVWPRGFPLDEIKESFLNNFKIKKSDEKLNVGIWSGMVNGDPDVDAVYRLVIGSEVFFNTNAPIVLPHGHYCPFNSQNTFWTKDTFYMMYLPIHVNFRCTDIFRSFIAQRLLACHDLYLGYFSSLVFQKRNSHNLIADLLDEIPCYMNSKNIVNIIQDVSMTPSDHHRNLTNLYTSLSSAGIVKNEEIKGVNSWLKDIEKYF